MRIHVVHAHPVETSYNRALFHTVVAALDGRGHEVDSLDLYAEDFPAALSREERLNYEKVPANLTPAVKPYVDRLRAADAIVFVHPVWNYGYPAILKGYFDRIFLPGVSFVLESGAVRPNLANIKRAAFVTSYGGDRWRTRLMGDPPRRLARRWGWATFRTLPRYLALYGMDKNSERELRGFIEKVRREFEGW